MRPGVAFGSSAAAGLARDDSLAQGVFGAPVGGLDRVGVKKKRKHRWEFDGEMGRESARHGDSPGPIDERIELVLQMTSGDGDALRIHAPLLILAAVAKRVPHDSLHARAKRRSR